MGNSVKGMMLILAMSLIFPGQAIGHDMAQGWAWSGIAASTLEHQAGPGPAPAPAPGDVCQTCSGSGKVGDGRVFQICKDCNGTGKVIALPSPQAIVPVKFDKVCEGGVCKLVPAAKPQPQAVLQGSKSEVICQGGMCYPVTQYRQYQTRPAARVIMRKGFFFRR